jgi:hypothetical protein
VQELELAALRNSDGIGDSVSPYFIPSSFLLSYFSFRLTAFLWAFLSYFVFYLPVFPHFLKYLSHFFLPFFSSFFLPLSFILANSFHLATEATAFESGLYRHAILCWRLFDDCI